MSRKSLPQWATDMSDEEWKALGEEYRGYDNCSTCGVRIILTLCMYDEKGYYCYDHCLEHDWQSDYDWPVECAKCGVHRDIYLERMLDEHGIKHS